MRRKRYDNNLGSQLSYTNKNVEYDITKSSSGYTYSSPTYKRYYSQIDANVYFGDVLVSDVQNIQYGLMQHDMPLFGYNSYIYDELAIGNRLVQGSFTINFTEPLYIDNIIKQEKARMSSIVQEDTVKVDWEYDRNPTQLNNQTIAAPSRTAQRYIVNPEHDAIWRQGFEIDISYGQDDDIMGQPLHVVLLDCHIMNVQTILDSSGRPILEQYSFLSRDRKVINS